MQVARDYMHMLRSVYGANLVLEPFVMSADAMAEYDSEQGMVVLTSI